MVSSSDLWVYNFRMAFVAKQPAALDIYLRLEIGVSFGMPVSHPQQAHLSVPVLGVCIAWFFPFYPNSLLGLFFVCVGAQRKGEVEVLRFVAAIFGIVEHHSQIAALPDFKGIIGGGDILLCQFVCRAGV